MTPGAHSSCQKKSLLILAKNVSTREIKLLSYCAIQHEN